MAPRVAGKGAKVVPSNAEAAQAMGEAEAPAAAEPKVPIPRWTASDAVRLVHAFADERVRPKLSAEVADGKDRQQLDDSGGTTFWQDLAAIFLDAAFKPELAFEDEHTSGLSPQSTKMIKEKAEDLKRRWNEMRANVTAANERYSRSGQHSPDRWDFCGGRKDVYYVWIYIEDKGLLDVVVRTIDNDAGMEDGDETGKPSKNTPLNPPPKRRRANVKSPSEGVDATTEALVAAIRGDDDTIEIKKLKLAADQREANRRTVVELSTNPNADAEVRAVASAKLTAWMSSAEI